jgi:hypothetical protein
MIPFGSLVIASITSIAIFVVIQVVLFIAAFIRFWRLNVLTVDVRILRHFHSR